VDLLFASDERLAFVLPPTDVTGGIEAEGKDAAVEVRYFTFLPFSSSLLISSPSHSSPL
jgi:hypothetical protein